MAGEVEMQQSGTRSLHLRSLRKQWQVITLQILATVALVWMYIEIVRNNVSWDINSSGDAYFLYFGCTFTRLQFRLN